MKFNFMKCGCSDNCNGVADFMFLMCRQSYVRYSLTCRMDVVKQCVITREIGDCVCVGGGGTHTGVFPKIIDLMKWFGYRWIFETA
jgi:hypothetical protein